MRSVSGPVWSVNCQLQGGYVRAAVKAPVASVVPPGGPRGKIHEFSRASRKRLLDLSAKWHMPEGSVGAFVSLSYGNPFPCPRCAKADLRAFIRRLERHCLRFGSGSWKGLSVIWRLEPQKRGAPHFHLIVFGPYVHWTLLAHWWSEIASHGDQDYREKIRVHGTSVETLDSCTKAARYVAKYVAKVGAVATAEAGTTGGGPAGEPRGFDRCGRCRLDISAYWDNPGRWWGVIGRENLPMAEEVAFTLVRGPWFDRLKRAARHKWQGISGSRSRGFTLYVGDALQWGELIAHELGQIGSRGRPPWAMPAPLVSPGQECAPLCAFCAEGMRRFMRCD